MSGGSPWRLSRGTLRTWDQEHVLSLQLVSAGDISIAFVTARPLDPNQGGMTAPNPPAGPPAATISRSLGSRRAVNSWVGPPLRSTMFFLPTFAHSPRRTRAERNMYS